MFDLPYYMYCGFLFLHHKISSEQSHHWNTIVIQFNSQTGPSIVVKVNLNIIYVRFTINTCTWTVTVKTWQHVFYSVLKPVVEIMCLFVFSTRETGVVEKLLVSLGHFHFDLF